MKTRWIAATTFFSFAAVAEPVEIPQLSPALKPHHAVDYRRGAFEIMGWHFKQMGAMFKGELPFDKAKFTKGAEMVSLMSYVPLEGFVKGTGIGEEKYSEAKHNVWKNFPDFNEKMLSLQKEAKSLAEISKTGDESTIKKQFENTSKTCKTCHDEYRDRQQH
jgi:cytochrome c556